MQRISFSVALVVRSSSHCLSTKCYCLCQDKYGDWEGAVHSNANCWSPWFLSDLGRLGLYFVCLCSYLGIDVHGSGVWIQRTIHTSLESAVLCQAHGWQGSPPQICSEDHDLAASCGSSILIVRINSCPRPCFPRLPSPGFIGLCIFTALKKKKNWKLENIWPSLNSDICDSIIHFVVNMDIDLTQINNFITANL